MILEWDKKIAEFNRGNALEATTHCALDHVHDPLAETWRKVIEIAKAFRDEGKLGVLVEVWSDMGRVIFRLSDRREFARIILNIQALEQRYYELSILGDKEFEQQHDVLIDSILNATINSLNTGVKDDHKYEISVVGRSSDDRNTERLLST